MLNSLNVNSVGHYQNKSIYRALVSCHYFINPTKVKHCVPFLYYVVDDQFLYRLENSISLIETWKKEWYLKTSIWVQHVLIATGLSLPLGPLIDRAMKSICITNWCIHTYVYFYMYFPVYLLKGEKNTLVHIDASNSNPVPKGSL